MQAPDRFDPYRVLRVRREASLTELARAYRLLAKRHHPDLHGPDASRQMRELNRAWQILSDPAQRQAWDSSHPAAVRGGVGGAGAHWSRTPPRATNGRSDAAPVDAWNASYGADGDAIRSGAGSRTSGSARVRAASGWAERGARPAGGFPSRPLLRDSPWPAVAVAAVLVLAVITLGWVASTSAVAHSAREAVRQLGLIPSNLVGLDPDRALAVYTLPDGSLGVAAAERNGEGWEATVVAAAAPRGAFSVVLVHVDSFAGDEWPMVAFGRAHGVERIEIAATDAVGGEVRNGTWAVGLREEIAVEVLEWRFLLPDGSVLLEGRGPLGG